MHLTRRYLVVGGLVTAAYLLIPFEARTIPYLLVGVACVVAILVGIRVNRPVNPAPWYLMAVGQAAWVVGDALYDVPDPWHIAATPADLAYLIAYPFLGAGIALLIRRQRAGSDVAGLIDSVIVTIGFGLLSWVFVADPIVDETSVPWLERAVAAAYPFGDILLLAALVRLVALPGVRTPAFRLLVAAILPMLLADTVVAATTPTTAYAQWLDVCWLASYVLWGAAALHPTMARLSIPTQSRARPFTTRRLAALAAAVLIAPALIVLQMFDVVHVDTWTVVFGAAALSLLVVARMAYDIEEIRTTARQRDQLRADLFHEASHDSLTGVANSAYLRQLIGAALVRGQRGGVPVGLLIVDIDDFGGINERFGHGVGDLVLRTVAERLDRATNDSVVVGRLGGDRFVLLVEGVTSEEAMSLAARLLVELDRPVRLTGHDIPLSVGIGAATSMDGGTDVDELLREAGVAKRRAKAAGRGQIEAYDNRVRRELGERAELTQAMATGQLELHYQPVVAVQTEIIDGYEAQLRWNRPGHGVLTRQEILPLAATSDLACELDRWVLTRATAELAALTAADPIRFADLTMSVTVSGRFLSLPGIVDEVCNALGHAGLAPHRLTIGVTEMTLVEVPRATLQLSALRDAGIFVCIDDFGTGRTPIGQLPHLEADALKLDRWLVRSADPGARDLLALVVNAAHGCGLLVMADGVEDAEQLVDLRLLECDSVQGIYSSSTEFMTDPRPLPPLWRSARLRVVPDET